MSLHIRCLKCLAEVYLKTGDIEVAKSYKAKIANLKKKQKNKAKKLENNQISADPEDAVSVVQSIL